MNKVELSPVEAARFCRKVRIDEHGCWLWTGCLDALADALVADGAHRWNAFCQVCAGDVEDAVWGALLRRDKARAL